MAKRTEQLEEKLRKAVEAEICNGNWLYFGKGDPVGHIVTNVLSVLPQPVPLSPPKKRPRRK